MEQLLDTKADLESYFTSDVLKANPWMSSEWVFVPMVYCEEIEEGFEISQTCKDFVIKGKLSPKLCNQVRSLSLFRWRTLTLLKI